MKKKENSLKYEEELVQRILRGDEIATEALYKKYLSKITDYVFGKIDKPFDAQEVIQDIFISALDCLPTFNFKSSFSTWLYAIAKHEVVDYYRKRKIKAILFSRLPFLETLASKALGPEEELIEKEIKTKIALVLSRLSEGYQRILRLRYLQGCSVSQVAAIFGVSYKAAESKLSRARLAFREAWTMENGKLKIKNKQSLISDEIEKLQLKIQKDFVFQFPS